MALTEFTEEMASQPEYFKDVPIDTIIEAKGLPFEDKVRLVRYCLTNNILINSSLVSNLILLIKGSTLEDAVYEDAKVIFKDLEEYIDIKLALKKEISDFEENVLKYYFGAFKSLSVKLPDGKVEIPGLYKAVLSVADIYMISKLLNKHKVDFDALPLVYEGDIIVQAVNFQNPLITEFMNVLAGRIKEDGITF